MNHISMWGVLPLAFPLMFWTGVVLFVLELIWCRRAAVVTALGFLCCAGPALSYCPLHVVKPSVPEGAPEFTLMTYNVHNFTIDHILYRGALKPLDVYKDTLRASDHYPVLSRFAVTDMTAN